MPVWFVFGVQSSAMVTLSRAGCACDGAVAATHAAAHSTTARIDAFTSYSLRWHYPDQVNTGPEPMLGLSHVGTPVDGRLALSSTPWRRGMRSGRAVTFACSPNSQSPTPISTGSWRPAGARLRRATGSLGTSC